MYRVAARAFVFHIHILFQKEQELIAQSSKGRRKEESLECPICGKKVKTVQVYS